MGLFSSVGKAFKKVSKTVNKAVSKVPMANAVIPLVTAPTSIGIKLVTKGPKAAMKETEKNLKNPTLRMGLKAAAMVFPPAAPIAAAQEAAIAVLNAAKSKNPSIMAGAITQLAATKTLALTDPGAKRAWDTIKGVTKAKNLLKAATQATGAQKAALEAQVAKSPAAQLLYLRTVDRASQSKNPRLRAAATKARTKLAQDPNTRGALNAIRAAGKIPKTFVTPKGFTVTKQGRVLRNGRLLRGR